MRERSLALLPLLLCLGCSPSASTGDASADAGACWALALNTVSNIRCADACASLLRQCADPSCASMLNGLVSGVTPCPAGIDLATCQSYCSQSQGTPTASGSLTFNVVAGCFQQQSSCGNAGACMSNCFAMAHAH